MKNYEFPEDVLADILSRLPVKSLIRFKCVCIRWRTLISSPFFASLHLRRSVSNPERHSVLVQNASQWPASFSLIEKSNLVLHTFPPLPGAILCVGSINGLVCVARYPGPVMIWNPSTRSLKELPLRVKVFSKFLLGFGWDPTIDDYKVVRLTKRWVEVWSTNSQSSKKIEVDYNFPLTRLFCDVIVDGFNHWIVRDRTGIDCKFLVVSFDMRTEELRLVPVPELVLRQLVPHAIHRSCALGHEPRVFGMNWKGNLALVGCISAEGTKKVYQGWTMDDTDWSKKFTFEVDTIFIRYFISAASGVLVFMKESLELILYDVETKQTKIVENWDVSTWARVAHYYVESLL